MVGRRQMDWTLLVIVTTVAAFLVARKARGEPWRWPLVVGLVASPLLGFVRPTTEPPPAGVPAKTRPGRYIGSDACAACHPNEHASWSATYHRTMTQVARGDAILAPSGHHSVDVDGRAIEITHKEGALFLTMPDPADLVEAERTGRDPREVPAERQEAVLTTGSHHYQAYWVRGAREGELRAAPVVWHREAKRFIPRHDVFLQPPDLRDQLVRWNSNCLACHATASQPGHDLAKDVFRTEAVELGIGCEACHGSGGLHADRYRDPLERVMARDSDQPALHIIHPGKIDKARSAEICGQCHAYAFPKDE